MKIINEGFLFYCNIICGAVRWPVEDSSFKSLSSGCLPDLQSGGTEMQLKVITRSSAAVGPPRFQTQTEVRLLRRGTLTGSPPSQRSCIFSAVSSEKVML